MNSSQIRTKLARILYSKSYREGNFTLTSGKKSDYYFDCKQTALHPEGGYLIGKLFLELISENKLNVQGIGGMTLGADPLISAVTILSYLEKTPLPGFIIRKEAKGHGTNAYLEGMANFEPGFKVCLLEDVVTTGGTLLTACQRVKDAGLQIEGILCVLDREEGGRENITLAGYDLISIFTRKELVHAAKN